MATIERSYQDPSTGGEVSYAQGPLSPERERAKRLLMKLVVHKAEAADLYVRILSSAECAKLYARLSKPVRPLAVVS